MPIDQSAVRQQAGKLQQ